MVISPSILSADFSKLGDEIISLEKNGADWIHVDVMDGCFVPNISFGQPVIKSIRKVTNIPFDVHLMIDEPIRYIDDFAKCGSDIITFHLEAAENPMKVIEKIKSVGKKPSVSIKPATKAEDVLPYIKDVFMVLVMTVEPGFGGQKFNSFMLPKIRTIREAAKKENPKLFIEVDGGLNEKTSKICKEAGADVIVAGSYVFKAEDRAEAINSLR